MKRRIPFFATVLFSLMIAIGCGSDADKDRDKTDDVDMQSQNEAQREAEKSLEFAKEAVSGSMMEIRLAEIVMERSQTAEIDEHARMVQTDHQKASDELKSLAASKNWVLPVTMMEKHENKVAKLRDTKPENINDEYLDIIVNTHQDAINEFERCADSDKDADLVMWVNKQLPILRQHLQHGKDLKNMTSDAGIINQ